MRRTSKPTPNASAGAGDLLYQKIQQSAYDHQWQSQIHQQPHQCHDRQAGLGQSVASNGLDGVAPT
jgi:hypothetical protein